MPWQKNRPGVVGLEISKQGIALVHMDNQASPPGLNHCEWLMATADGEMPKEQLRERIEQLKLEGSLCNVVMPVGSYSLLLTEAPNVPEAEMRNAVRFKIRDLINFPVEDALVDLFPLPDDSSRSGRKMIYVVVAEQSKVMEIIELVKFVKLKLAHVDIAELALRNLIEQLQQDTRGAAAVLLLQNKGILTLIRAGQLYLSRQFDLAYNAGLLDDIPDEQLLLELQRSLDYYERQMGQMPPGQLYVCGENVTEDKLTENLRGGVAGQLSMLNIGEKLAIKGAIDDSMLQLCLNAIGGALRQQEAA